MFNKYTQAAIEAAQKAGNYALERHKGKIDIKEKTKHLDYVTDVDTTCEAIIKGDLLSCFPDHLFLGEECGLDETEMKFRLTHMTENDYIWVVDPLDGTVNYVHGLGLYCVSIALMHNNEPITGVIFIPETAELFVSEKGSGSWLNGERINVSSCAHLYDALIGYSVPAINMGYREAFSRRFHDLSANVQNLRMLGSCAAVIAYVACGKLDGYIELGHHPWDIAAGYLLVEEAGGVGTDFSGRKLDVASHQMVVSNGHFHNDLVDMIRSESAI